MRLSLSAAIAASASVLAILATACSAQVTPSTTSSSGNVPKKDTDKNTDTDGNEPAGTSSSSPSSSSSGSTPEDKTPKTDTSKCSSSANQEACYTCCAPDPSVFDAEIKAFDDCACGTNGGAGVCKTQCGNDYCKNPDTQPSAACEACLSAATQCDTAAQTACDGVAGCKAAYACADASKCDSKPE